MRGDLEAEGRRRPRALYGTFIKVRRCLPGGAVPCDVIAGHTPFHTPHPTGPNIPRSARPRSVRGPAPRALPQPALIGRPAVASGRREAPCDVMAP